MATDRKPGQRPEDVNGKPLRSTRREQLLAQAKLTQSFELVAQRNAVSKLMFESVLSGACTPAEILEAAYDDRQGYRYWELWLFEPLQIYQFAELLALHNAGTERVRLLDRYLLQIFERLRAAAEAGETWFIGDTSPLVTENWSSLALRNSALAVRPREAITWMRKNPNARGLVPRIAGEIVGSIVAVNSPTPASASSAQDRIGDSTPFDAALNPEIKALDIVRSAVTLTEPRRRGPKPTKLEKTKEKMRRDVQEGRQTADALENMLEKDLASSYGVSRDTARRARNAVLSEIVEHSISTNNNTNDK
ncbi:MAG: hypothetical protein ACLQFW_12280 [Xanthobacteraceae bacterium]